MTADDELLAIALWAQRTQGAEAPRYIAEQIGALALRGDAVGIERWRTIAAQFEALVQATPPVNHDRWLKVEVALVTVVVVIGLVQLALFVWRTLAALG